MFVNRTKALEITISNINTVLSKEPFSDTIDFYNLNLTDEIPKYIRNKSDSPKTSQTATLNGSSKILLSQTNSKIAIGQQVLGDSIPPFTYVVAIGGENNTELTLSNTIIDRTTQILFFYDPVDTGLYDKIVDTYIDLTTVSTLRIRPAILKANVVNGRIDSVDIVDHGYGYTVIPPIEIIGNGTGAEIQAFLDTSGNGTIDRVSIIKEGKNYGNVILKVRNYSVLVNNDETSNGLWSIYAWDNVRSTFYRSAIQAYDTPKYWSYIDWWMPNYSTTLRISYEIPGLYAETEINPKLGEFVKVKE
jgi:hypothetical protein